MQNVDFVKTLILAQCGPPTRPTLEMLAVAKQSEKARAAAQQRQRVVGGATSAAASSGPTGAQRWRQASSVVDIVSEQPEDLEVAMLDKRIADLRRELDQLSEDQTATVTFVSAEIDRSLQHVASVPRPPPPHTPNLRSVGRL